MQGAKTTSLLSCASGQSAWRGYDYYLNRRVESVEEIDSNQFQGKAHGSNGETYDVFIDVEHPRKSSCTCPHAAGKRIVCKHQIALFFTAFPLEAAKYYQEVVEHEQEQERLREEEENKVIDCIDNMTKEQLQQALMQVLFDGPEWQYDRFIREYVDSSPFIEHDGAQAEWMADFWHEEEDEAAGDDEDEESFES